MSKARPSADLQKLLVRARALARQTSHRGGECFWVEGIRHFIQAHDGGFRFEAIVLSPVLLKSQLAEMLARRLKASGIPRVHVTPEQFRSVSTAARASGIGALVQQRWTRLDDVDPTQGLCWLAIEEVRSPGNLGTILRTAEACGVGGVILIGDRTDPYAPDVVRASMGGIFHLSLVRTTFERFARWAKQGGVNLVGLSPDAPQLWAELPQAAANVVVVGEERAGISQQLRQLCNVQVRLPMVGRADSLNVSVAAGVMMYEFVRRAHLGRATEIGP